MTTDELVQYYVDLLIAQYNRKPNARAFVDAMVRSVVADQIVQQTEDAFDIDTALGAQLDLLGTYRGASRAIVGLDLGRVYFVAPEYSDIVTGLHGFALYTDPTDPFWYFASYEDSETLLTDADFRIFLKYLTKLQSLDLGLGSIDAFLFEFFGVYVMMVDNGDMTITYTDDPSDPSDLFKIVNYTGNLPHPSGVTVDIS